MAMTYLTKLKPEPMGEYSLSTAYGVNSLVMSEDGATAYISVKDVPAGTPLTNTEYWKKHTDLTAVKQSAEAATQKANAARDEMLEIARNLTDTVEKIGNPVQAELVGGMPFDRVTTALSPIQAGSGDPSPDNIRPISGWTGAELTRCGKNLLNLSVTPNIKACDYSFDPISGVYRTASVQANIANRWIVKVPSNTDVRMSVDAITEAGILEIGLFLQGDATTAFCILTSGAKTAVFNTGNHTDITISVYTSTETELAINGARLTIGSTATAYEPYQGNTYSADFGQTVYGGTLDWQTGVLTVDRAFYTFDGSEAFINPDWTNPYAYVLWNLFPDVVNYGWNDTADAYCSHYIASSVGYVYSNAIAGFVIYDSGHMIFSSPTHADVDAFKSYIAAQYAAGTPVQIVYKLATPQTIQLTPQEIKQLQGMNTLYGDGSISIIGRADKALALDARIAALEAAG